MEVLKMSYEEVDQICSKYHIRNWRINDNGLVDVKSYVTLTDKKLEKIPLNFGTVDGNFDCGNNNLTSLQGCPKIVRENFYCDDNKLTSLEYGPRHIANNMNCNHNYLTTLEHCPKYIGGRFYCANYIVIRQSINHINVVRNVFGNVLWKF